MPQSARRRAALTGGIALAALAVVSPALAGANAAATAAASTGSGSWGVAAAASGGQPAIGTAFVVHWVPPITPAYLEVVNTGTLSLSGTTYGGTNSKATNGAAPPEVAFDACVGAAWNPAGNGTCAGQVVRLASTSGGTFTVSSATTAVAPGARLSVRGAPISLLSFPHGYSTTLTLSVSRAQARAASTTGS